MEGNKTIQIKTENIMTVRSQRALNQTVQVQMSKRSTSLNALAAHSALFKHAWHSQRKQSQSNGHAGQTWKPHKQKP